MSTGRIVATTHGLVFISLKLPTLLLEPTPAFVLRAAIALTLQILALLALSVAATGTTTSTTQASITDYERRKGARDIAPDVRQLGAIAGMYTLVLPLLSPGFHTIVEAGLRVVCFFYACKAFDLVVLRAGSPPQLVKEGEKLVTPNSWSTKIEYVFRLLTETRYGSFDIAIQEPRRNRIQRTTTPTTSTLLWTWLPRIIIPAAAYFYPVPELQILLSLLLISIGLEGVHTLFQPFCANKLFFLPFSAPSIAHFWSTHCHQGAQTWLLSLAYTPATRLAVEVLGCRRELGRAVGVPAAFAFSGVWHGWCAAAMSERGWEVGLGMFLVFLGQGIGCLVETTFGGVDGGGGLVRRVLCWGLAVESGAMWLRFTVPTLKEDVAWLVHPIETLGLAKG